MNQPWHRNRKRLKREEEGNPFERRGYKELGFGQRCQCSKNGHLVLHGLDLNPCCMNLMSTMSDPYGMVLIPTDKEPSKCVKCERKDPNVQSNGPLLFRGESYVSSCGNCYHVYSLKKMILDNWERGYFNVASSSSSSRGRNLSRGETVRRSSRRRSRSVQSDRSSITSSRRGPSRSVFNRGLIKMAKVGFSIIKSFLVGNPTPLFTALAEIILDR